MKSFRILFVISIISMFALAALSQTSAKPEAEKAGLQWLGSVDSGDYAGSYDSASSMFKAAITKENWVHALNGVRPPLGTVVSRQVASATHATELPGAPDGEYVVMRFKSSFENKKQAVETLTMVLEKDGQWRSTGYFIK